MLGARTAELLGDVGDAVRLSRMVDSSSPELGGLVGDGRLRLVVQGRTTMTFGVRDS